MVKKKNILGALSLCSLFVSSSSCYNQFHKSNNQFAEKGFLSRCKQIHCQEECKKMLAEARMTEEYRQSTANNKELRCLIRKMTDNRFSRDRDKDLESQYIEQAKDLLISHLTNPNELGTRSDITILIAASNGDNHEFVQWLLDNGRSDVNFYGRRGYTALHAASSRGSLNTIRVLLKNGANPTIKNEDGVTALDMANRYEQLEAAKILSEYMSKNS